MTSKQIQKMTQKRKYQTIKTGIVSTLITALMFSVFCLVIITRLQAIDDKIEMSPEVSSVIDGKINKCIRDNGEYSFYYSNFHERYIFSCVVGGEVVEYYKLNK